MSVSVNVQAADGWQMLGTGPELGVLPESVRLTYNVWGCETAGFTLRRKPGRQYPDLSAFTPIEIEIDGQVVWSGRVKQTPQREGADFQTSVECEGWQYHLDDDPYQKTFVHTRVGDWRDSRTFIAQPLATYYAAPQISQDRGVTTIQLPNGNPVVGLGYAGVTLDLGPNVTAAYIFITWDSSGNEANTFLYARASTTEDATLAGNDAFAPTIGGAGVAIGATSQGAFPTPRRYVHLFLFRAATATFGADIYVKLREIRIFASTAYHSSGASILKATDVVQDTLSHLPLLNPYSSTYIPATSFSIPEFTMDISNPRSPREIIQAANAFHNYDSYVDVGKNLNFQAQQTAASIEVGAWSGSQFEDASANSGEDIYDRVIVTGSDAAGNPVYVTTTDTDARNLVGRRGFHRTKVLPVSAGITAAVATQIGTAFLDGHKRTNLKGSVKIIGSEGARATAGGLPVAAHQIGPKVNQLLRLSHVIDPYTGGIGRDGKITAVEYTHADRTASVSLDNTRDNFQAFLERLSVVTGQVA